MTPEVERFLDLATRPLEANPNERDEAKGELMSRIGHTGVPYEMLDLGEPLQRLAGAKPAKHGLRRSLLLAGALLLLVSAFTAVGLWAWQIFLIEQASSIAAQNRYGNTHTSGSQYMPVLKHVRSIAPSLPFGLDDTGGSEETAKLLAGNPDDLPMLQEHVIRRLRESGTWEGLTASERETTARLDPDNALWQLMQITPALSKATGSSGGMYYYGSTSSTVTSEPDFQEALRLFSEAAAKPSYFDRSSSLKRRQMDAFPPARSLTEDAIATEFADLVSLPFGYYSEIFSSLARLHCDRLVAAKDTEGLTKFYREWMQLSTVISNSPELGVAEYNDVFHQLAEMGKYLAEAFDQLGMAAEKADAEKRSQILKQPGYAIMPPPEITKARGVRLRSKDRLPSNLTLDEVIPSRQTELSFLDRIQASLFACLGLIFVFLVAFETRRRSRIVKGMARGLTPLFRKEDHVWIAALGLALPWLWWWAITRLSPLGWRDGDIEDWVVPVWLLQSSAGVVLSAVMLLQTARWRWTVRGGFLGLGGSLPWIGWGVAMLTALSIPVAGSLRYFRGSMGSDDAALFMLGVAGMAACGLLWLLWHGIMTLFTPRSGALRPNLTMRAVLPWAMTGVATLLISTVISTAMERYWFSKDPLFPAWTSKTHVNALEERIAEETPEALRGQ